MRLLYTKTVIKLKVHTGLRQVESYLEILGAQLIINEVKKLGAQLLISQKLPFSSLGRQVLNRRNPKSVQLWPMLWS